MAERYFEARLGGNRVKLFWVDRNRQRLLFKCRSAVVEERRIPLCFLLGQNIIVGTAPPSLRRVRILNDAAEGLQQDLMIPEQSGRRSKGRPRREPAAASTSIGWPSEELVWAVRNNGTSDVCRFEEAIELWK